MSRHRDKFFIGWEPTPAKGPVRFVRNVALILAAAAVVLAGTLAALQDTIGEAGADWNARAFRGVLIKEPIPMLIADRPDAETGSPLYYLANQHGVGQSLAESYHLQEVTLEAAVLSRARGLAMLEVVPDSVEAAGATRSDGDVLGPSRSLGTMTLQGEIVDAKCYMGAMNPGQRKPHRACAILCIQGGLPAVFVVRGTGQSANYFVLLDEDGHTVNDAILEYVALPVEITGEVKQIGHLRVVEAPLSTYRFLEE